MNNDNIYDFSGLAKLTESIRAILKLIVEIVNSPLYINSIQSITNTCVMCNDIIQKVVQSNTLENVIKPTIQLYAQQMNRIYDIVPKIMTPDIYNTILSYKSIFNEININDLKINDNGTIEYEGNIFTEDEIEESSIELIKDIEEKKSIKIDTILKRILLSFLIIFATFFISGDDIEWIFIAMVSGFFGQPGANMSEFFKNKFFKKYECEDTNKHKYFTEHSAIVKLEELKVRKKPNSNEELDFYIFHN